MLIYAACVFSWREGLEWEMEADRRNRGSNCVFLHTLTEARKVASPDKYAQIAKYIRRNMMKELNRNAVIKHFLKELSQRLNKIGEAMDCGSNCVIEFHKGELVRVARPKSPHGDFFGRVVGAATERYDTIRNYLEGIENNLDNATLNFFDSEKQYRSAFEGASIFSLRTEMQFCLVADTVWINGSPNSAPRCKPSVFNVEFRYHVEPILLCDGSPMPQYNPSSWNKTFRGDAITAALLREIAK